MPVCECLHAVRKMETENLNEVGGGQPLIWILWFDLCNSKPAALKSRLKQNVCCVLTAISSYCAIEVIVQSWLCWCCNGIET